MNVAAFTDRDLVATAVSGAEGSFEELVRRYRTGEATVDSLLQ